MIQVKQRPSKIDQFFDGYKVTMSLDRSIPHQAILTVKLIQKGTQNHYLGQYTFQTLQPTIRKHFQNIQCLYKKIYDSIKNNDKSLTIESNGRLSIIFQVKDQTNYTCILINTKLIQMNKLTDFEQAIELLFSKTKQNKNLVLKMKQQIMNEVIKKYQKSQLYFQKIREQQFFHQKQISQLKKVTQQLRKKVSQSRKQASQQSSSLKEQFSKFKQKIFRQSSSMQQQISQQFSLTRLQISSVQNKIFQQVSSLRQKTSLQASKLKQQISCIRKLIHQQRQQKSLHKQQIDDIKNKLADKSEKKCLDEQVLMLYENIKTVQNSTVTLNECIEANTSKNNRQLEQANKRIQILKQEIRQLKLKLKKIHKISIDKLQLTSADPQQLNKQLLRYKQVEFDQVCISNDRLDTALNHIETIKQLGNLRNVTKLEIKWCKQMKAQVSMEILNTMPHLKQLALLEHSQKLSQNFMKKLCQFKQLKLFYINSNSHPQYYRSFNEDEQFSGLFSLQKNDLPSIKELVELSKLPKLQNIEISLVNNPNRAQIIKNMKSLRHLTLGYSSFAIDEVDPKYTKDTKDTSLIQQLHEQRALITLSLIGVKVESKQVDYIIKNNPNLKTIIIRNIHDNENINDGTVECMANLIQLQNLCIQKNAAITGLHLSKLDKLIMLEIYDCQKVSKKEMREALMKMQKLQHLKINANKWFDDEVITSVQSCKQLTYLNIGYTQVSWQGLKHLKGLTRLNILICGYNKINGKNLIELTKQTPRITRLSIFKLNVNDNQLQQISANCQALTHLDIRKNEITVQTLLKIKQLKVVRSGLEADSKKKLKEKGIKTY